MKSRITELYPSLDSVPLALSRPAFCDERSVILPLSEVDSSLSDVELDYKISQRNKDKWNYGFRW